MNDMHCQRCGIDQNLFFTVGDDDDAAFVPMCLRCIEHTLAIVLGPIPDHNHCPYQGSQLPQEANAV